MATEQPGPNLPRQGGFAQFGDEAPAILSAFLLRREFGNRGNPRIKRFAFFELSARGIGPQFPLLALPGFFQREGRVPLATLAGPKRMPVASEPPFR